MGYPPTPHVILSVSALTAAVRSHIESAFADIWVEGEVSNLRMPSSGHAYFTLKDATSQMRAVMFRSVGRFLRFHLKDGMCVICRGRLTVYEPKGDYQMLVDYAEPKGVGALQVAFEQLKERLAAEGLFEAARKRPLPAFPRRLGIITSPTGAAIRDIIQVAHRRWPNIELLLNPVGVQGIGAAAEIAKAIAETVQKAGGVMTVDDLAAHETTWHEPIGVDYRGVKVWECPPNGQGIACLLALNILEGFDVASIPAESAQRWHLLIEAMRVAFADTSWYVADPKFSKVPVKELLSNEYAAQRRKLREGGATPAGSPPPEVCFADFDLP